MQVGTCNSGKETGPAQLTSPVLRTREIGSPSQTTAPKLQAVKAVRAVKAVKLPNLPTSRLLVALPAKPACIGPDWTIFIPGRPIDGISLGALLDPSFSPSSVDPGSLDCPGGVGILHDLHAYLLRRGAALPSDRTLFASLRRFVIHPTCPCLPTYLPAAPNVGSARVTLLQVCSRPLFSFFTLRKRSF